MTSLYTVPEGIMESVAPELMELQLLTGKPVVQGGWHPQLVVVVFGLQHAAQCLRAWAAHVSRQLSFNEPSHQSAGVD